jgi:hypothetical protein
MRRLTARPGAFAFVAGVRPEQLAVWHPLLDAAAATVVASERALRQPDGLGFV